MKKHLIILEDATEMGGVQHSTLNFILGARKWKDLSILLLIPGKGGFSERLEKEGVSYTLYPSPDLQSTSFSLFSDKLRLPNPLAWLKNARRLRQTRKSLFEITKDSKADVLITKGMGSHFLGGPLAKELGIPCLMYLQDEISNRYLGLNLLVFNRFVQKYADQLIADGASIKTQLWQKTRAKCHLVYNGVSAKEMYRPELRSETRRLLNIPEDAYVIAHLARITPWKGQHLLLDTFIDYAREDEHAYLILMGSPLFSDEAYFYKLQEKARAAGLEERVLFPGYVKDAGPYFAAMDLFVYPSVEKDTAPLALLSALMSGKPVLMSDIPSLQEIFLSIPEIVLFRSGNKQDLLARIRDMKGQSSNGEALRKKASRLFSIEAMTENVYRILQFEEH